MRSAITDYWSSQIINRFSFSPNSRERIITQVSEEILKFVYTRANLPCNSEYRLHHHTRLFSSSSSSIHTVQFARPVDVYYSFTYLGALQGCVCQKNGAYGNSLIWPTHAANVITYRRITMSSVWDKVQILRYGLGRNFGLSKQNE